MTGRSWRKVLVSQSFGWIIPKDLRALIYVAKNIDVDPTILQAVWDKNEEVRPAHARDWEQMKGRAVSDD